MAANPFDLADTEAYLRWREQKLSHAITDTSDLIVEIDNPRALTAAEHAALLERCRRSNMAIYVTRRESGDDELVRELAQQFGLHQLDANWLADDEGVTHITVRADDELRQPYIPYTNRPIKWHTDGYYNPPERHILAMVLHCVRNAAQGGENRLLDHEIAYIQLRDANPEFIRALSAPEAMTIPERTDENGVARAAQPGPVFWVDPASGQLTMRYTARTRSIVWHQDATTLAAVAALEQLLAADSPHIHHATMENGMGLLCNNVLHDRSAFVDDPASPRLLLRARYRERIAGT